MFTVEHPVVTLGVDRLSDELANRGLLSDNTELAIAQALRSHATKQRDSGRPYTEEHIFPVTFEVVRYLGDYLRQPRLTVGQAAIAALLHDAPEDDPNFTIEDCEEMFSLDISKLVYPLTRIGKIKDIYDKKIANANWLARVIKLADRRNNLSSSITVSEEHPEKLVKYTEETERVYLPIARSLIFETGDDSYVRHIDYLLALAKARTLLMRDHPDHFEVFKVQS